MEFLVYILMGLFLFGCAGCLIVIPVVAFKFASVLAEHELPEENASK